MLIYYYYGYKIPKPDATELVVLPNNTLQAHLQSEDSIHLDINTLITFTDLGDSVLMSNYQYTTTSDNLLQFKDLICLLPPLNKKGRYIKLSKDGFAYSDDNIEGDIRFDTDWVYFNTIEEALTKSIDKYPVVENGISKYAVSQYFTNPLQKLHQFKVVSCRNDLPTGILHSAFTVISMTGEYWIVVLVEGRR